jgi:hypothetical protein
MPRLGEQCRHLIGGYLSESIFAVGAVLFPCIGTLDLAHKASEGELTKLLERSKSFLVSLVGSMAHLL